MSCRVARVFLCLVYRVAEEIDWFWSQSGLKLLLIKYIRRLFLKRPKSDSLVVSWVL
jgi:hypothetical protein